MKQQVRSLFALLMCAVVLGALPVLADEIVFPDPALDAAIRDALGLGTGPILSEDLGQLTSLRASRKEIVDLTGMEACTELVQLDLCFNQIVDLAPLAGLQTLTSVSLSGNNIVDISPLGELLHLTSLTIHSNQISDVQPIASLPYLASLSIGNAIEDIEPLAALPRLVRLMVYVLPTADLLPLLQMPNLEFLLVNSGQAMSGRVPFDPTVLTSSSKLMILGLHGYDIAQIADLANAVPSLANLELRYVGIDDLSMFHMFDALTNLTLYGVVPCSEGVDLSHLNVPTSVTTMSLENNGLNDLAAIADCTWLTSLNLARNKITDIDALEGMKSLTVLTLSFNEITDLEPLRALPALKSLTLQGVPFDRTEGSAANILIDELRDRGVNIYY